MIQFFLMNYLIRMGIFHSLWEKDLLSFKFIISYLLYELRENIWRFVPSTLEITEIFISHSFTLTYIFVCF